MRRFAELCDALEAAATSDAKVDALAAYFDAAPADDAACALHLLAGRRPRRAFSPAFLRTLAPQASGLPDWLWQASLQASGDLAETLAHVLPPPVAPVSRGLAEWLDGQLWPAHALAADARAAQLVRWLGELDSAGRDLLIRLLAGGLRIAATRSQLHHALGRHAGLAPTVIAERMAAFLDASDRLGGPARAARLAALRAPAGPGTGVPGQPYPFHDPQALPGDDDAQWLGLGACADWQAEWLVDGLRVQIVRRAGRCWIWSRDGDLLTDRLADLASQAARLPDGTVLDGTLLAWDAASARPAPSARLQAHPARPACGRRRRLGLAPLRYQAFDLLELDGHDQRARPLHERRAALQALLQGGPPFEPARGVDAADWQALAAQRAQLRAQGAVGLLLRRRDGGYGDGSGGTKGVWWRWKVDPLRADAVLVYARPGQGLGGGAAPEYSFAVWNRAPRDAAEAQAVVDAIARREPARPGALQLVTVAKATDAGLPDPQARRLSEVVQATLLDKFGPVRSVLPSLVVELGYDGVTPSPRHKSGVALGGARMLRIVDDRPLHEAATLDDLHPPPHGHPDRAP